MVKGVDVKRDKVFNVGYRGIFTEEYFYDLFEEGGIRNTIKQLLDMCQNDVSKKKVTAIRSFALKVEEDFDTGNFVLEVGCRGWEEKEPEND